METIKKMQEVFTWSLSNNAWENQMTPPQEGAKPAEANVMGQAAPQWVSPVEGMV
jgi:hypothetical protein